MSKKAFKVRQTWWELRPKPLYTNPWHSGIRLRELFYYQKIISMYNVYTNVLVVCRLFSLRYLQTYHSSRNAELLKFSKDQNAQAEGEVRAEEEAGGEALAELGLEGWNTINRRQLQQIKLHRRLWKLSAGTPNLLKP